MKTTHALKLLPLLLFLPLGAAAGPDLANGERINRNCALCHGTYGQGANGRLSPRLAGLPVEYLIKATQEYKDGKRINPTMVETAGLKEMSEQDILDVSAYLNSQELSKYQRFNIVHQLPGDAAKGAKQYDEECGTCHGDDGRGKPKKKAPPLAAQHTEYLFQSMKMFQGGARIHDNDAEDDTFKSYSDDELLGIAAHLAGLDDDWVVAGLEFTPPQPLAVAATATATATAGTKKAGRQAGLQITDIRQTVAQMELKPGVTAQDSINAMLSKATELNLKLVGQQEVSKELEARGVETPYLTILQFCNPMDARTMVVSNPVFSSYMPCRISLVADKEGKLWLMMLNLDMLINSELLSSDVVDTAIRVNQQMLDIMVAGATGEF